MNDPAPKAPLQILYFARLSEQLGCRDEELDLPDSITTTSQLRDHLAARGSAWTQLQDASIRVAVNQDVVGPDTQLIGGEEVAFFPPVTGG